MRLKQIALRSRKRGFTLTELIMAIMLMAAVGLIIGIIFNTAFSGRGLIEKEATIQSEMRLGMQQVNNVVQKATGIFVLDDSKYKAVPSTAVGDQTSFLGTAGWSYIGLSDDGKKLMNHVYSYDRATGTGKWVSSVIGANSPYELELDLNFETVSDGDKTYEDNRLLKYNLGGKLAGTNNKLAFDTSIMGLNTKQIFSKVAKGKKGIALAYRNDEIVGQINTAVSLVFDVSGSMLGNMQGHDTRNTSATRLAILKRTASKLIDDLGQIPNISVNLVTFSITANYIDGQGFTELTPANLPQVKNHINAMTARGATNPGDGLRYAMIALSKQPARLKYIMLLTDGLPTSVTMASWRRKVDQFYTPRQGGGYAYSEFDGGVPDLTTNIGGRFATYRSDRTADNPNGAGNPEAVTYVRNISAQPYAAGVKDVTVVGFSANARELARGKELSDAIVAGGNAHGITSKYVEAANEAALDAEFKKFQQNIAQDLWFIQGP